jgi:hypothetical protein
MKYISFSPYSAGLCNVLLSLEVAIAISITLERKLIIPPKVKVWKPSCTDVGHEFLDIYHILDKETIHKNVDCIDFYDVPEFVGFYEQMASEISYTKNISKVIPSVHEVFFGPYNYKDNCPTTLIDPDLVIYGRKSLGKDFKKFVNGRNLLNLWNNKSKFIHFENNLFSLHWYSVYPGEEKERNHVKQIINKSLTYNKRYYQLAEKVFNSIGKYNSVHIRRNDFKEFAKEFQSNIDSKNKLLEKLKLFFDTDIPLYIATDENDKELFEEVSKHYKIYFYDDFEYDLEELDQAIVEQLICSNSELFYGTYLSTYSARINIIRGINGKQSDDYFKIDKENNEFYDTSKAIHWNFNNKNAKLNWAESVHPHWKIEKNGVYIDAR